MEVGKKPYSIRRLRHPKDYAAVAPLLSLVWSEPTTAAQLQEDEEKIPPGVLHYDEKGLLRGWDRPKWVAEDENGRVVAYATAWRTPWTAAGALYQTVVVRPDMRGRGIGRAIARRASGLVYGGSGHEIDRLYSGYGRSVACRRGYVKERHTFESVLELESYVGVDALIRNEQTGALYHEYTGVLPEYRGRQLGLALKLLGIRSAQAVEAPYLRTHNDSMTFLYCESTAIFSGSAPSRVTTKSLRSSLS